MSTGRGRGYTGRHSRRADEERPRPGTVPGPEADLPSTVPGLTQAQAGTVPVLAQTTGAITPGLPQTAGTVVGLPQSQAITIPGHGQSASTAPGLGQSASTAPGHSQAGGTVGTAPGLGGDDEVLRELLRIDEQFKPVLAQLERLSPGEDGIVFNRKLRDLETAFNSVCEDEVQLQRAFSTLCAAALSNAASARRLSVAGAAFTRQQPFARHLRRHFLNAMQATYDRLDILERGSSMLLVNAANLLGDYFAEARLSDGGQVCVIAAPLLGYMTSLLACSDPKAHRSLATQLMQNGRQLLTTNTTELEELSVSIRCRLLSPPPGSTIWLMLSADLCLNKFVPLPTSLQQFYASHLDLSSEDDSASYNEVAYGSWKEEAKLEDADVTVDSSESSMNEIKDNVSQLNVSHDETARKPRPILGAGAGISRRNFNNRNHSFRMDEAASVNTGENVVSATAVGQDNSLDMWSTNGRSLLAKRYDLNSWRQGDESIENGIAKDGVPDCGNGEVKQLSATAESFSPPKATRQTENWRMSVEDADAAIRRTEAARVSQTRTVKSDWSRPNPNAAPFKSTNWRSSEANDNTVEEGGRRLSQDASSKTAFQGSPVDAKGAPKWDSRKAPVKKDSELPVVTQAQEPVPKVVPKKHVTEVPRNQKYWDHDDRLDHDYDS